MKTRNVLSVVLSLTLVLGFTPTQGFAADQVLSEGAATQADEQETPSWPNNIDALLSQAEYAEGEVLVTLADGDALVADVLGALGSDASYERLFDADGTAYESASGNSIPEEALAAVQEDGETVSAEDVTVGVYLVDSPTRSVRDMLETLATDARVLSASPNYLYGDDESDDAEQDGSTESDSDADGNEQAEALDDEVEIDQGEAVDVNAAEFGDNEWSDDAATNEAESVLQVQSATARANASFVPNAAQDVTTTADATSLQWAFNRSSANTFKGSVSSSAVLNISGWNTTAQNATGVVAVLDTGVDYNHPDLAGAMMDMSSYQSQVGGTARGYNVLSASSDPLDDNGHGTHVAGIIAASSNGYGVSGAANGVKLLPVKVADSAGRFKSSDIQRGYAYLKKVAQSGVDLRVVNNSWSGNFIDDALSYAVFDLGELGVVSVFASGNNATDIDNKNYTATGMMDNQYAVVVDSLDMNGLAAAYTNTGAVATDVFAPGSTIMSTTRSNKTGSYVASAMRASSSTYVTFTGESDTVSAQSDRGAKVGSIDATSGFDDEGGCLSLTGKELANLPRPTGTIATKRVVLEVPVDESKLDEASVVGCAVKFTGSSSTEAWLEVFDSQGKRWWDADEKATLDAGNWNTLSLDLHKVCTDHNRRIAVCKNSAGQSCIKIAICINAKSLNANTASMKIDCVGVGSQSWHYGFMSGTSMAAPVVSGLVAVLTSKIPNYTSLEVTARAEKAATLINASARKGQSFANKCLSGGMVNPSGFSAAVKNDTNPYVGRIFFEDAADGSSIIMTMLGIGFGDKAGKVYIDSKAALASGTEIVSWSDGKIVMKAPMIKGSSKVTTTVTNTAGSESSAYASSVLGGEGGSDEPDDPKDPENPGGSDDPQQPETPEGPGGGSDDPQAPGISDGSNGESDSAGGADNAKGSPATGSASASDAGGNAGALASTGDSAYLWLLVWAVVACGAGGIAVHAAARRRD